MLAKNIGCVLEKLRWDAVTDSASHNACCCWAGGAAQTQPTFPSSLLVVLELGQLYRQVVWSPVQQKANQGREEGKRRGRARAREWRRRGMGMGMAMGMAMAMGKGKGKELLWVRSTFAVLKSTCWLMSNNLRLMWVKVKRVIWSLLSTRFYVFPLFYVFLHLSSYFSTEVHSSNIFILFSHQLCCPPLNLPSLVLLYSSRDWVLRVAHGVPGERETARYIRAL